MISFTLPRPLTRKEKFIIHYLPWIAIITQMVSIPIMWILPVPPFMPYGVFVCTMFAIFFSLWYMHRLMKNEQRLRQVIREERVRR